jgi:hypothetical protein
MEKYDRTHIVGGEMIIWWLEMHQAEDDRAVEDSALALRLHERLLAKACRGSDQLQLDVRKSSQDLPHVSITFIVLPPRLRNIQLKWAVLHFFFAMSQAACIVTLPPIWAKMREGPHDFDGAGEAEGSSAAFTCVLVYSGRRAYGGCRGSAVVEWD